MTRLALALGLVLSLGCATNFSLPPCVAMGDAYCERKTCNAEGDCTTDRTEGGHIGDALAFVLRPLTEATALAAAAVARLPIGGASQPESVPSCDGELEPLGTEV